MMMKRIIRVFLAAALLGSLIGGASAEVTARAAAPLWADVQLNDRGFLDEGEYVLEDAENGHWMYVSPTLRIEIVKTWETPEKKKKAVESSCEMGCDGCNICRENGLDDDAIKEKIAEAKRKKAEQETGNGSEVKEDKA